MLYPKYLAIDALENRALLCTDTDPDGIMLSTGEDASNVVSIPFALTGSADCEGYVGVDTEAFPLQVGTQLNIFSPGYEFTSGLQENEDSTGFIPAIMTSAVLNANGDPFPSLTYALLDLTGTVSLPGSSTYIIASDVESTIGATGTPDDSLSFVSFSPTNIAIEAPGAVTSIYTQVEAQANFRICEDGLALFLGITGEGEVRGLPGESLLGSVAINIAVSDPTLTQC